MLYVMFVYMYVDLLMYDDMIMILFALWVCVCFHFMCVFNFAIPQCLSCVSNFLLD